jgi:hypothetical protein
VNILLDECVPRPLRKLLANHTCRTAQEMGWKSVKNPESFRGWRLLKHNSIYLSLPIRASPIKRIFAVAGLRFLNSQQTNFDRSMPRQRNYEMSSTKYRPPSSVASKSLGDANFWVPRARLRVLVTPKAFASRGLSAEIGIWYYT